jgi:hypothetical protein
VTDNVRNNCCPEDSGGTEHEQRNCEADFVERSEYVMTTDNVSSGLKKNLLAVCWKTQTLK